MQPAQHKAFAIVGRHAYEPRRLAQEKKLARIAVRCPEDLKIYLERRACTQGKKLSRYMLDLAVKDLEAQQKTGRTLADRAGDLVRAAELARAGIENDEQRIWVLERLTAFQAAVLHAA